MSKTRKELKFICDERMLVSVENRIRGVMKKDSHQTGSSYNIRSIYFDSPTDRCFLENQSGVGKRRKYRLRIYDCNDKVIKAEVKSKDHDCTHKLSAGIGLEQFSALMNAQNPEIIFPNKTDGAEKSAEFEALGLFGTAVYGEGYHPVSIVEYERSAYYYEPCNVRVTFDRNIAASRDYAHFFERDMAADPLCETGVHILEVKYDEFLPDHILQLLRAGDMRRTSYSKYYQSRLLMG